MGVFKTIGRFVIVPAYAQRRISANKVKPKTWKFLSLERSCMGYLGLNFRSGIYWTTKPMKRHKLNKTTYNPLINFLPILLAILGHVVPNRRAGVRQYTPSVTIFALPFVSGKKAYDKANKVGIFSVFFFFNSLK